ncbi:MAG TPA: class I SAM-dependent methyltransferase [Syntrophobacteraceae bacterium]|nr:class I SAM-dependent methyltransferase [Syntrophobacteraceae bacterium]
MINTNYPDASNDYYNIDKPYLWKLIPDGPNVVLDLGCASGLLGRRLRENRKAAHLVGVEVFAPAAQEARKYYDIVHIENIEDLKLNYDSHFDVVVCGDILEHLKDPFNTLKQIHRWLKRDGMLICSLANIRYWKVLNNLIFRGEWEYTKCGILDSTHLRFFTKRSFKRVLIDTSFNVIHEDMLYLGGAKERVFNRITLGLFREFIGFVMIIAARKV